MNRNSNTSFDKDTSCEKAPVEIERKFLVRDLPENLNSCECEEIRQGYLVIGADGSEARVRERNGAFTITIKSKGSLSRGEWEVPITDAQFDELWPATEGKRIEKTRYSIPFDESLIELDVYKNELEGLVSAEVEFSDEQTANNFSPPEWFSAEVTENKSFKNQQLATKGLPR